MRQDQQIVAAQRPVQVREQAALTAPGGPGHADPPGIRFGFADQVEQRVGDRFASDETARPLFDELVQVPLVLLLPGGRRLAQERLGLGLQVRPQILQHLLPEGLEPRDALSVGVPLGPVTARALGHHPLDP